MPKEDDTLNQSIPNQFHLASFKFAFQPSTDQVLFHVGVLAMLVAALMSTAVDAATYNAAKDFQTASNPGTPWSYGYSVEGGQGYSISLFDRHVEDQTAANASAAWSMSSYNISGAPVAWLNASTTSRYGVRIWSEAEADQPTSRAESHERLRNSQIHRAANRKL